MLAWQYKDNNGHGPVFFLSNYGNAVSGIILDSGSRYTSLSTMIHTTIGSRQYFDSHTTPPLNQWLHIGYNYNNITGLTIINRKFKV
jgi:hypothetical protein